MNANQPLSDQNERIILGKVSGFFGVRGWVKLYSYTDPKSNILSYKSLYIKLQGQWQKATLDDGRLHGKGVIGHFSGYDTREAVSDMLGAELAIERSQLKPLGSNEYYWHDLIGLQAINVQEHVLGRVVKIIETAAHDVLVIQPERQNETNAMADQILIPYVLDQYVLKIEPGKGKILVDWQPEWNED